MCQRHPFLGVGGEGSWCKEHGPALAGFFCVTGLGGLYMEGLIFGILWYLILVNLQVVAVGKKRCFRW